MKRGTPLHPKTRRLARRLELPRYAVVGLLELLWHFTAQFARRGDVGRYADVDLADALAWDREPAELITALVETGWLDEHPEHRLVVHHWHDHADEAVRKALQRAGEDFVDGVGIRGGRRPTQSADVGLPEPEPMPMPLISPRPPGSERTMSPGSGLPGGVGPVLLPADLPEPAKLYRCRCGHELAEHEAGSTRCIGGEPLCVCAVYRPKTMRDEPAPWAFEAAEALRAQLREHKAGARVVSGWQRKWASAIAQIPQECGDAPEGLTWPAWIASTIAWLFDENLRRDFPFVVQSGEALREKFGRIQEAREREVRAGGGGGGGFSAPKARVPHRATWGS